MTGGQPRLRIFGLLLLLVASVVFSTPRFLKGAHEFDGAWRTAFFIYATAAVLLFLIGMSRRVWVWTSGRPDALATTLPSALQTLLGTVVGQRRVLRKPLVGWVHAVMFWSFASLFVLFSLPALGFEQGDAAKVVFSLLYLALATGGVFLAARLVFATRKTRGLSMAETAGRVVPPLLLAAAGISYFFTGHSTGAVFFHFACIMAIFALIPYSRLLHIVAVPLWTVARPDERFAVSLPFDLSRQSETEITSEDRPLGPRRREEFTMRSLLAFDACTRCGRCEDVCPATTSGDVFSPAQVMKHLQRVNGPGAPPADLVAIAQSEQVDACTTCGHCVVACPVDLEPVSAVLELRRAAAFDGRFESGHESALRRVTASRRMWDQEQAPAVELEPAVPWPPDPHGEPVELVYWVGCAGRHDPAGQRVAATVAGLLNRAGVRWTTAGREESCTGDAARRMGDEGLFQQLALRNIALLRKAACNRILVNCAHCFNALAKEYRAFGADFEVIHHSELLVGLIEEGRLGRLAALPTKVTFHDPCYLGRHNGRYEPVRELLDGIEGFEWIEMGEARERSRCCGAGGGRLWRDGEPGARMATLRASQACETGAHTLVTACPFCLTMLEDPASKEGVVAQDISEVIAAAVRS